MDPNRSGAHCQLMWLSWLGRCQHCGLSSGGHLGWSFEEPPITGVSCCGSPGADCANIGCPFTAFPQLLGPRASWVHTLYHPVFWGLLDPDELSSLRRSLLDNLSPISHRRTPASPAPASSRYTDCSHSSPLSPLCVPRHSS